MTREPNLTKDPNLTRDLATLADEDRRRLGEAPSMEQLIALRDGRLEEDEADRVRDRLAVDPELAALYLDLKRFPDLEAADTEPASDVDAAWRKITARLAPDAPTAKEIEEEGRVVAFRRRPSSRALLAMAASLVLAAGLAWLWVTHTGTLWVGHPDPLPKGAYHTVNVDDENQYRGFELRVPTSAVGVALHLDIGQLEGPGKFVVVLSDASERQIRLQREDLDPGPSTIVFRVASSDLKDGKSYRLTVRSTDAPENIPPIFEASFRVVFGDFELIAFCNYLDSNIDRAFDIRSQGDWEEARALYEPTLDQATAGHCSFQEARVLNGLGSIATLEGRLFDALRTFDRARSRLREPQPPHPEDPASHDKFEATIELNRSSALLRLGLLDDAADAHRRVRALYRRHEVSEEDWAHLLLGTTRVQRLRGRPREAEEAAREGLERLGDLVPKVRASLWQELAWLHLEDERFDEAEQAHELALEALEATPDEMAKAHLASDRAELAARRRLWAESLEEADRALRSIADAQTRDLHLESLLRYLKSRALWELGEKEPARRVSAAGLALLESLHNGWQDLGVHFFAIRQKYYRHRLDVAASIEGPAAAWSVFESYRARGLLESSRHRVDRSSKVPDPDWQQQWEPRLDELVEAVSALDLWDSSDEEDVLEYREALFRQRRLALNELRAEVFPAWGSEGSLRLAPEAVSDLVDDETLALTFAEGERNLHVFTVDRHDGIALHTLDVTPDQVTKLARQISQRLAPGGDAPGPYIQELGDRLLAPLAEKISAYARLAIVADKSLEQLPFEVLRLPRRRNRLVETHEIAYLPSLSFLAASRDRIAACPRPPKELLAMGDPIFGPSDPRWPAGTPGPRSADDLLVWRRLAATAGEVEALDELYKGEKTIALGPEATRERFLSEAPKHRILHLASHARSHSDAPERSRVALSCLDARGQVLEPCDLYFVDAVNLGLCGQVVVLSACKTAGGRAVEGEGILGLPWTFLQAGAATVVASLWEVDDAQTAALMMAFHRGLSAGAGPAEALQQAKLERVAAGAPPSVWAPFVVLGNR